MRPTLATLAGMPQPAPTIRRGTLADSRQAFDVFLTAFLREAFGD